MPSSDITPPSYLSRSETSFLMVKSNLLHKIDFLSVASKEVRMRWKPYQIKNQIKFQTYLTSLALRKHQDQGGAHGDFSMKDFMQKHFCMKG